MSMVGVSWVIIEVPDVVDEGREVEEAAEEEEEDEEEEKGEDDFVSEAVEEV